MDQNLILRFLSLILDVFNYLRQRTLLFRRKSYYLTYATDRTNLTAKALG